MGAWVGSHRIEIFTNGPAQIAIFTTGNTFPLITVTMPLTPGPLIIALRADSTAHLWPPTATSIETIAASYVPAPRGSAEVRLFNLAAGISYAGFKTASGPLATNVAYSIGKHCETESMVQCACTGDLPKLNLTP